MLRCQIYDLGVLAHRPHGSGPPPTSAVSPKRSSLAPHHRSTPQLSMIDVNVNVDSDLLSSLRGDYPDAFWEFTRDAAEKSTPLTSLVSAQPEKCGLAFLCLVSPYATCLCPLPPSPPPFHAVFTCRLSREELVKHAQRMFASIRIYAGMDTVGGFFLPVDKVLSPPLALPSECPIPADARTWYPWCRRVSRGASSRLFSATSSSCS